MSKKYDKYREKQAAISRRKSQEGRDIGPIPPVVDSARRESCRRDLRLFCETYLPNRFPLKWSPAHLTALAKLQQCILSGGQFAYAMPRGSGKTTIAEAGALFALVYGYRRFVVLVGATETHAKEMLASLRAELEVNDLLLADFPEVCYPIRRLDGINHRAGGQLLDGERTRILWTDTQATLPTVPGSAASGSVLRVAGITGRVRGMKAVAGGEAIRPDLAIVDDPQSDESAFSPAQNAKREKLLNGAVLGLAGPRTQIACFVPTTVIAPGDLADRILDRDRYPVWQGERSRMVLEWPAAKDLWDRYTDLRRASQREGGLGEPATEFYREHREAMDAGAVVSWPERMYPGELSAIQHAMNLRADRGQAAFDAEFQNDPQPEAVAGLIADLDADAVAAKGNQVPRGVVPPDCQHLTAFVDVGVNILYYAVCGWSENFSGWVVDYGTCPRQNRAYFAANDARPTLADLFAGHDETARVYAGLRATTQAVVGRPYPRLGGGEVRVSLCLVDTGWLTDTVYAFCRESALAPLLLPARGYGIGASANPMANWPRRQGERPGWYWRRTPTTGSGRGEHIIYDTNHWKSFTAARLLTPMGGAGCLSLFGAGKGTHQLFADHAVSEFRVRTTGRGREVDEWRQRPERPDNHWWDCLVGCAVGASVLGCQWSAAGALGAPVVTPSQHRRKLTDIQAEKRAAKPRPRRR